MDGTGERPAAGPEPADWLLRSGGDSWDLVRYGPSGFAAYVRIAFAPPPDGEDPSGEALGLRRALLTLARHTTTPDVGYAAVWEGWTSRGPAPEAPRLPIPDRTMLLLTGPVAALRDASALAWRGAGRVHQGPYLVWPEDHAWCLACEVDEEIEFTVGCDDDTAGALLRDLPGTVRRVEYGSPEPLYREPG